MEEAALAVREVCSLGGKPGLRSPWASQLRGGRRWAPGDELPNREPPWGRELRRSELVLSSLEIIHAQEEEKGDCSGTSFSAALEGSGEFGSRSAAAAQAVLCPGPCVCQK